jgi:hypothetical protein
VEDWAGETLEIPMIEKKQNAFNARLARQMVCLVLGSDHEAQYAFDRREQVHQRRVEELMPGGTQYVFPGDHVIFGDFVDSAREPGPIDGLAIRCLWLLLKAGAQSPNLPAEVRSVIKEVRRSCFRSKSYLITTLFALAALSRVASSGKLRDGVNQMVSDACSGEVRRTPAQEHLPDSRRLRVRNPSGPCPGRLDLS